MYRDINNPQLQSLQVDDQAFLLFSIFLLIVLIAIAKWSQVTTLQPPIALFFSILLALILIGLHFLLVAFFGKR